MIFFSLHSTPRWRFSKSEQNTNESNAAPRSTHDLHHMRSTHDLRHKIDTWFSLWDRHTISATRLTHDICSEIDTRSLPSKLNADVVSPYDSDESQMQSYNWFQRSQRIQTIDPKSIQIEFVIPSGNFLQTLTSIVTIPNYLAAKPNRMHYTCLPYTSSKRKNTIWADQQTCLQLSNWMEYHSKWPQDKPNMSQEWLTHWWEYQLKCFQDGTTKSE